MTQCTVPTPTSGRLADAPPDVLERGAWGATVFGFLTLPWIDVRVLGVAISDVGFLIAAGMLLLSRGRYPLRPRPSLHMAAMLALVATVLSSFNAEQPNVSIAIGLRVVFLLTVWTWTLRSLVRTSRRLDAALAAYVAGACVSAVAGLSQAQFTSSLGSSEVVHGRVQGLTEHVNDLGGTLALAAPIALFFVVRGGRPRVPAVLAIATIWVGLILSGSVTGMLSATIGLITFLFLLRRATIKVVLLLLVGFAAAWQSALHVQQQLTNAASPLERLLDVTGHGGQVGTMHLRLMTIQYAWEQIGDSPWIGAGLDPVSGATYDNVTQTHNTLLLAWFQGGLLMLLAIVLALGIAGIGILRLAHTPLKTQRDVCLAAMVGMITFAMTAPTLFHRYFWLSAVLAVIIADLTKSSRSPATAVRWAGRSRRRL